MPDAPDQTDPTTTVILERISGLGYVVDTEYRGGHVVRAAGPSGESRTVRRADLYTAACELAEHVGIDLADG